MTFPTKQTLRYFMRLYGNKNAFLLDNNAVITQSSFTLDLLKSHVCCFVKTCASLKT